MFDFTQIDRIIFKNTQIQKAYEFLQYAGTRNVEAVVLFAGREQSTTYDINQVIIPKQTGYILENGLMYAVEGDELHKINVWLYENNLTLMVQMHTHPQRAYHSSADDRFPIVDTYGGISIVVPYFAAGPRNLLDWAIYRLSKNKTWDELTETEVKKLFRIL